MAKQEKLTAKKEVIARKAKEMKNKLKCKICNDRSGMRQNKEWWKRRANVYENILLHHRIHVIRATLDALEVDETTTDYTKENL